jgi:hypothetical protein
VGKASNIGLREQVQPRDFCTLGVAWGGGSGSGSGGTFEWVDSGTGALPEMEAWMGAWNGTVHSLTSNGGKSEPMWEPIPPRLY